MNFAQNLCCLMENRNVSAYKISKDTGISDRLIGYWRKGEKLPGAENLLTIANYFNVSVDYLLGVSDNDSSHKANYGIENHSNNNSGTITNQMNGKLDGISQQMLERFENLDFSNKIEVMTLIDKLSKE